MSVQVTAPDTLGAPTEIPDASQTNKPIKVAAGMAPYVLVWALLLAPTIRAMSRGWRPLADDATIALNAWNTFSLHFPLLGQATGAATGPAGVQTAANPGPLEYWLLGPFVHLDPGQGVLLGSAVLSAAALSVAIHVLKKTSGYGAVVIFALVVADLAIVSPTPFVDPTWNSSFAFFWFLAFMAVAFAVGRGNLGYFPLLVFFASVTIDSHLSFLPSIACVLVGSLVFGWHYCRPCNGRWLAWTGVVVVVCWFAPAYQQVFGSHPNVTLLAHADAHTFGLEFGLRAFSRAASLNPIWVSPRPILPYISSNDIDHRSLLLCLALLVLFAVAATAWRKRMASLGSMAAITTGSAIGVIALYDRIPHDYFESFIWVNLPLWVTGICIWLTIGLAAVTFVRPLARWARSVRVSDRVRYIVTVAVLGAATVAATLVVLFPYTDQGYLQDFAGMSRAGVMASIIESRVPPGDVGMGIRGSDNFFQAVGDEHGVAYLLRTAGWVPGMEPTVDGTLGYPIHRSSPFVVFTERGTTLTGFRIFPHYVPFWGVIPLSSVTHVPRTANR